MPPPMKGSGRSRLQMTSIQVQPHWLMAHMKQPALSKAQKARARCCVMALRSMTPVVIRSRMRPKTSPKMVSAYPRGAKQVIPSTARTRRMRPGLPSLANAGIRPLSVCAKPVCPDITAENKVITEVPVGVFRDRSNAREVQYVDAEETAAVLCPAGQASAPAPQHAKTARAGDPGHLSPRGLCSSSLQ